MTGIGGPAADSAELDAALAETVRREGASLGLLYLLAPDGRLLLLDALCGAGAELAAPWRTVPVAAPAPVADAVRYDRLVWAGGQDGDRGRARAGSGTRLLPVVPQENGVCG
ncbi:hypothetical protein [Streptomyces sennicomposti]